MSRVMYINPAGYVGGAEKSLLELAQRLPAEGFQPLVALFAPGPLEEKLRERGIPCRIVPLPPALLGLSRKKGIAPLRLLAAAPFHLPAATARLVKLIREEDVAIVHTNGIKAHLLAILPAFLTGRTLVWHFRDLPGRGGYGRLFRLLARVFPNRVVANSRAVKKALGNLKRCRVVYNGIDLPAPAGKEERTRARRGLNLAEDEIAVGTVGHFAPLKGYEDLIRAIPPIRKKVPAARFLITGGALYPAYRDYRRALEELARELGVADRIVFTGERDDPGEILAALDIFVLPSRSEGFGRANLEAMASGLPVVSTRIGGIPEVVIDGETGILVPPNQPEALAEAIAALAEDPALRRRLGTAGRKRAADFTIPKMVAGVAAVYREILSRDRDSESGGAGTIREEDVL